MGATGLEVRDGVTDSDSGASGFGRHVSSVMVSTISLLTIGAGWLAKDNSELGLACLVHVIEGTTGAVTFGGLKE